MTYQIPTDVEVAKAYGWSVTSRYDHDTLRDVFTLKRDDITITVANAVGSFEAVTERDGRRHATSKRTRFRRWIKRNGGW